MLSHGQDIQQASANPGMAQLTCMIDVHYNARKAGIYTFLLQSCLADLSVFIGPVTTFNRINFMQGAERQVRFPEDLQRFANLPMRVEYMATSEEELPPKLNVAILLFAKMDNQAQIITWHLANVRVNRPKGKGSKLTRRQLQEELSISVADLRQVNLYLDI